ncbi:MAG: hypothetical protein AAF357_05940, partial [Verrucomicrobiota bacterium]
NEAAIEEGKKAFPELGGCLRAGDGLVELKGFPNNSFDLVFTVGTLQNIPYSDAEIFGELARVTLRFVLVKEPDALVKANPGIHSIWDYEEKFGEHGLVLILKKHLPKNCFGGKPSGRKVPVLRIFSK